MEISSSASVARKHGTLWAILLPALVFGIVALVVYLHGRAPYPLERWEKGGWDQYFYVSMAQHPFAALDALHEPPFCWRLLVPTLAYLLHCDTLLAFWLLTLFGLLGAAFATRWFLRGLGVSNESATAGAIAFVLLGPATGYCLWFYQLIDPLSYCLIFLAMAACVHRRAGLMVTVLLLGALCKETIVIAACFCALWSLRLRDRKLIVSAFLGGVACAAALLAIRVLIHPNKSYSFFGQAQWWMNAYRAFGYTWLQTFIVRATTVLGGTFSLLLPIAMLQFFRPIRLMRAPAFWLTMLLTTSQIAVALDVARPLSYMAPLVIGAAATEMDAFAARRKVSVWLLWVVVFAFELPWLWEAAHMAAPPDVMVKMFPDIGSTHMFFGWGKTAMSLVTVAALLYEPIRSRFGSRAAGGTPLSA